MLSSQALVLSLLALSVALAAGFVTVPVERVQVSSGPASLRRYLLDPVNALPFTYAALLNIGGQNYRFSLDTGSSNTFLTAVGCNLVAYEGSPSLPPTDCPYSTNFYDGNGTVKAYDANQCSASVTYEGVQGRCQVRSVYLDGSVVTAIARTDSLEMGPYNASVTFGAATSMTEDFLFAGIDGVLGMSRPNREYLFLQNGPLGALFDAGMPKLFSICLTATAGELHLGGSDIAYAGSEIRWFTYDPQSIHYTVQVTSVRTGSTSIPNSAASAIIDSGHTYSTFPAATYNAVVAYIKSQCPSCPDVFSDKWVAANPADFPSFSISFNDVNGAEVTYTFVGKDYLWQNPSDASKYTFAINSYDNTAFLIGAHMMRYWYTIFDIRYGVVGLAPLKAGKCSAPSAAPIPPLSTIPPSLVKPPISTGGLTEEPNSEIPLPPAIDSSIPPVTPPIDEPITAPTTIDTPSATPNASEPSSQGPVIVPNNATNTPFAGEPAPSASSTLTRSFIFFFALLALMLILN